MIYELSNEYGALLYPALAVAALFVLALILLKPEKMYFWLLLFLGVENVNFLYYSVHQPVPKEKIYIFNVLIVMLFTGLMMKKSSRLAAAYPRTGIDPWIFTFFVWVTLSLIWSQNRVHGAFEYFRFLNAIMLFFLTVSIIDSEKKLYMMAWTLTLTALLLASLAAVSLYVDNINYKTKLATDLYFNYGFMSFGKRAGGLMGHNFEAFYMNICLPFSFEIFRRIEGRLQKAFFALIPLTIMLGMFLTRSRAASVALLVGFVAYVLMEVPLREHLRKNFIRYTLFAAAVVVAVFLLSAAEKLVDQLTRFARPFESYQATGSSFFARLLLWSHGFKSLVETMGFGVGLGGFKIIRWYIPNGHSLYFTPLFDLGFVGLAIWLALFARLGRAVIGAFGKSRNSLHRGFLRAATAGLIMCAVHGVMDFDYIQIRLWLAMAITMAVVAVIGREGAAPPANLPVFRTDTASDS